MTLGTRQRGLPVIQQDQLILPVAAACLCTRSPLAIQRRAIMSLESKGLREKRATLAKEAGEIITKAKTEARNLSAEESQKFDKIHADIEAMKGDIDRIERQEKLDLELADIKNPA